MFQAKGTTTVKAGKNLSVLNKQKDIPVPRCGR